MLVKYVLASHAVKKKKKAPDLNAYDAEGLQNSRMIPFQCQKNGDYVGMSRHLSS